MKISESWLREWVNPVVDVTELAAQLTMAGLEVDGLELAAPNFSGVVVGEIISIEPHPNADKLRVCQVAGGKQALTQVVCGAPNACMGLKVPFAIVGAQLPADFVIKETRIRDVESLGMLCGEEELGLAEKSDGLWEFATDAPVGTDVREYLNLDDTIIEVDLTPNRGDCLSIRGIAREVGVVNKNDVKTPAIEAVSAVIDDVLPVSLNAGKACPKYAGRIIKNINLRAKTPQWMVDKLRGSDVRSVDPVVDVTNYVLLELGQPMHAFDLNKLRGAINVRTSLNGEKPTLLDGSEAKLEEGTLVITDDNGIIAVAGIMGGEDSAVSTETCDIFIESAYFDPIAIAGKARSLGKHTDASHRFERGVDPELPVLALERATQLLMAITGGEPGPVTCEVLPEYLPIPATVPLNKQKLAAELAIELSDDVIEAIFALLGFELVEVSDLGWVFKAPSWRFDIAIEADLIEEVARIYGYNNLPTITPSVALPIKGSNETQVGLSAFREKLLARGYQEAITYSFVEPKILQKLTPELQGIQLLNPIASDMAVMRTTLWAGLLPAIRNNLNRQQSRVRFFEVGQRFIQRDGKLSQDEVIAGAISGSRRPEGWTGKAESVDFFDLKADVEAMLALSGSPDDYSFIADVHPALHPGQSARIEKQGITIGWVGNLHPSLKSDLSLSQDVYLFEIDLAPISQNALPVFEEVSKFPRVTWDLAFIVDEVIAVGDLLRAVKASAGSYLTDLKVFDVYQGKGVENNRKSVALGLTFQHRSRTLDEQEITAAVTNVVAELEKQFSASLRGEL